MIRRILLYVGSAGFHLGLGYVTGMIPTGLGHQNTVITVTESRKPEETAKNQPPPEQAKAQSHGDQGRKVAPSHARPDRAAEADKPQGDSANDPGSALDGFVDIGLSLGGGGGIGGIAVPTRPGADRRDEPRGPTTEGAKTRRTLVAPRTEDVACSDPLAKPVPETIVQPAYTEDARLGKVEGRVRVEVVVDIHGKVKSARVLEGLGHGLDESAAQAARQMVFRPGTRCGKPVESPFIVAMRFVFG